jgi:hypothetical protein
MKRISVFVCVVLAALLAAGAALAQMQVLPPGASQFNPPLPPPPPPPKIEAPVVPQMDAPLSQNYQSPPLPSFSDRITRCLDQGAAAGLGPGERAAYSRSCANQ